MNTLKGIVTFGIAENAYDAIWYATDKTVQFILDEPIPIGPYKDQKSIVRDYTGAWDIMIPYGLAGHIVNDTMKAIATQPSETPVVPANPSQ